MKWTTFICLVLFSLLLWGSEHARRNLWEPDEARYAYVAREMMQDGHWAIPHRHGEYYAHKPPLYFWLVRAASMLAGGSVNGVTARLPSLLATIASLSLTALFALRLFGRRALWPSVLVLATSFLFWHEGGMGRMDSVLLALELGALYLLIKGDDKESVPLRLCGYVCMGLGVLAKGPVGLLVPLIAYLVIRRMQGKRILAAHIGWGVPIALLFPLLWLAAAWVEGAPQDYFKELIFKQNFGRVAGTANFGKPRPVYFYLLHVPAEFMPWTVFLPASIYALKKAGKKLELKVLVGWALAVVVFFTLSSGKRNLYVLLAYPAMALMIAGACEHLASVPRRLKIGTVAAAVCIMTLCGVAEAAVAFEMELPFRPAVLFPSAAVLLGGAGVTLGVYAKRGFGRILVYVCAGVFLAHYVTVAHIVFPALNAHKTPVELVEAVRPYADAGETMVIYGSTSEIVPLYCNMKSRCASDPESLKQQMADQGNGVLVMREKPWIELNHMLGRVQLIKKFTVGHKTMVAARFESR